MHLAQLNIARSLEPLDSELLKDFVDNLDRINAVAEKSEGFVWRLKDEGGNATEIQAYEDPNIIANLSVWESVNQLKEFMFKTDHVTFMKRRYEWFEKMPKASYVLWYVPEGHIPSLSEAKEKLRYLQENGDSPLAFSFKRVYESVEYQRVQSEALS